MKYHRAPVLWLNIVAVFVVLTLLVGGATRLTDSGLSITEWEPILGVIPPLSHAAWEEALELYRQIPEYQLINRGMSMSAFQEIYLWEWAHRLVARTIGLVFLVPFVVFWWRGMLPGWFKPWGIALLALGGLQGAVGWWMVASGLTERVDVSQYRLAVHLTLACVILSLTVWLAVRLSGRAQSLEASPLVSGIGKAMPFVLLAQIALGALVAGIDAGLASDTWPLMMGALVPEGLDVLTPVWINAFENPLTVQFNHRIAGYAVILFALVYAVAARHATPKVRLGAIKIFGLVVLQALIGIGVVVWHVPPHLASVHQVFAALILWVAVAQATRLTPARETAAEPMRPVAADG